jgi:hypothetical protein
MESLTISKSRIAGFFLATLIIYVVSYVSLGVTLSYILFGLGLVLIPFNFRLALSYYLIIILLSDDINKFDVDLPPLNTIFTATLGGLSISLVWTVIIFLALMLYFLPKKIQKWDLPMPMVVMVLFTILGAVTIHQIGNDNYISDVGFVVNIIAGFLLGQALLTDEKNLRFYFAVVVVIFMSKYLIMSIDAVIASVKGVFYGFKGESAANYIVIPLVFALMVLFYGKLRAGSEKKIYYAGLLFLFAYLFITITRERIILATLALAGFLIIYKKTQIVLYFGVLTIVCILAIKEYNPNMYNFVQWKLTTFMPSSSGKTNPSSTVRYLELKNIWKEQLQSPHKLFIGTGWGGYFTSRNYGFTKNILGTRSYPEIQIERDQFFRPHGTYLYLMLKYGTLGVILFYLSVAIYSLRNIYDKAIYMADSLGDNRVWLLRYIQVSVAFAIPLTSLIIFTSKLQVLTGFFIAMLFFTSKQIKSLAAQARARQESNIVTQ